MVENHRKDLRCFDSSIVNVSVTSLACSEVFLNSCIIILCCALNKLCSVFSAKAYISLAVVNFAFVPLESLFFHSFHFASNFSFSWSSDSASSCPFVLDSVTNFSIWSFNAFRLSPFSSSIFKLSFLLNLRSLQILVAFSSNSICNCIILSSVRPLHWASVIAWSFCS